MTVRYDPLMARAIAREIRSRWKGQRIVSLRFDRGRRAIELRFEDDSRLLALLHPLHGHVFALRPDSAEPGLEGVALKTGRLSLVDAIAPADERALLLTFGDREGRPWEALGIELQTQRWNAVHCRRQEEEGADAPPPDADAVWTIETALVSREAGDRPLRRGARYLSAESNRQGIDEAPDLETWNASLADVEPDDRRRAVLETWAWTSTLNVAWLLDGADDAEAHARYRSLHVPLEAPTAWQHETRVGPQPYPHPLGSEADAAGPILDALAAHVEESGGISELLGAIPAKAEAAPGDDRAQLKKRLGSRRKRLAKRHAALERQLAGAGPPDEARAIGQLLLARKAQVPKGRSTVEVEDFDGSMRELRLDPTLDAVGNAEAFFDEARRRERALDQLPGAIEQAANRVAEVDALLEQLEREGPTEAIWDAVGGKPAASAKRRRTTAPTRLPYSELVSSGGLEIRVGRGAKDNDDLTFRHSAPDDIWLHASQSSGAHVILRWGKKGENPPRRDLLEAAIAAAVNSGARHAGTVPVVWTRRKHVRKPRKSPAGTVVPNQVETLFVKPDEDLVKSLRKPD